MNFFSPENLVLLIKAVGYLGVFAIVFAESGLLVGFFLPGDSLLFTAGLLASQHYLNIYFLIPVVFIGAVIGDSFGYSFGRKFGPKVFSKEKSLFFHRDNLDKAKIFYEKHGAKTIILARFMPFIRTFAPVLAGVGNMHYGTFLIYNLIGGALWSLIVSLLGFYLGNIVPNIDSFILPIILGIIVVSISPSLIYFATSKIKKMIKKRKKATRGL